MNNLRKFEENLKKLLDKNKKKTLIDRFQEKFGIKLIKCLTDRDKVMCYFNNGQIINIKNIAKIYYRDENC